MNTVARWEARLPWLAGLVTLAVGLLAITSDPIGVFFDDGVYAITAQALAEGAGYRFAHLPEAPPAIHYPPLWPALLAMVWTVAPSFPANVAVLKLLNPLLLASAAVSGTFLGVRSLGLRPAVAAVAVTAGLTVVPLLALSNVLLSEACFLAVLFPALLLVDRALHGRGWRWALLAGLACGALALVRTIGGLTIPAAALALLLRRDGKGVAGVLAGAVLVLAPWQVWVWQASSGFPPELLGSYGPYLSWVAQGYRDGGVEFLSAVVAKNVGDLWRTTGIMFSPLIRGAGRQVVVVLVLAALVTGGVASARRALPVGGFIAGYLAVVLVWPYQADRFAWGIWPLLLLVMAAGVVAWWRLAASHPVAVRGAVVVAAAVLLLGHQFYSVRAFSRGWYGSASGGMARGLIPLVRYVESETSPATRVASDAHVIIGLYTGRRVVPTAILQPFEHLRSKTADEMQAELRALDARYQPDLYVFLPAAPELSAIPFHDPADPRMLQDITPAGAPFRVFRPASLAPDTLPQQPTS